MKKIKESLAKQNLHRFKKEDSVLSASTEEHPNGMLVLKYNDDKKENFLLTDGSVISVLKDGTLESSDPNKELLIEIQNNLNGDKEIKILDNRMGDELDQIGLNRMTILKPDGTAVLFLTEDVNLGDGIPVAKDDIKEQIEDTFGLKYEYITSSLKAQSSSSIKNFIDSIINKEQNEQKIKNKPRMH